MDGPQARQTRGIRVAIAIISRGDDVLICRRKSDAVLGGLWEFPGGKIAPGESPEQAAVREVREELGIEVTARGALAPITFDYPHGRVELLPIVCDYVNGDPRPIGCADWRWATRQSLDANDFPPANVTLLNELRTRRPRVATPRPTD